MILFLNTVISIMLRMSIHVFDIQGVHRLSFVFWGKDSCDVILIFAVMDRNYHVNQFTDRHMGFVMALPLHPTHQ